VYTTRELPDASGPYFTIRSKFAVLPGEPSNAIEAIVNTWQVRKPKPSSRSIFQYCGISGVRIKRIDGNDVPVKGEDVLQPDSLSADGSGKYTDNVPYETASGDYLDRFTVWGRLVRK
jgi:hypothetical protein